MSTAKLKTLITQLRTQVDERQKERRSKRIEKTRNDVTTAGAPSLNALEMSADVAGFFLTVRQAVERDSARYFDTGAPVVEVEARGGDAAAFELPADAQSRQETRAEAASACMKVYHDAWAEHAHLLPQPEGELPPAARHCYAFMTHELRQLLEEQGVRTVVAPALLAKLKQAVAAFGAGRSSDTITLLKNALNGDPHNATLLAILSQVLYLLAATGQQTVLPEAREYAQRSIIYNEKIHPQRLAYYRYLAIVTELAFGQERALMWLRETGFLSTSPLKKGADGIMTSRGIYLRAWAILSRIQVSLWGEQEFSAVYSLATEVVGGGAVYLHWLRRPLTEMLATSKTPMPDVEKTEKQLIKTLANYEEVATGLRQMPLKSSPLPWFLRVRYLNTLSALLPAPSLDQVLAMVALDGQTFREHVFPDKELRTLLDDPSLAYWQLWGCVITPYKDVRLPYLMPTEETVQDAPLLATCDALLAALKEAEQERIKANVWEDLKPWMNKWQMEHLLAAGTGSNRPRSRFMPSLAPYTHFYRAWQDEAAVSPLPSEVIGNTARKGAFASLYEILAAFEGSVRLLDDPRYGLAAAQKQALATAKKHNPAKFGGFSVDFGGKSSGMMYILLPLGMIGAVMAIFKMSANMSQAIGLTLALAGVAGVVAINLRR